jgi:hypothetical protein
MRSLLIGLVWIGACDGNPEDSVDEVIAAANDLVDQGFLPEADRALSVAAERGADPSGMTLRRALVAGLAGDLDRVRVHSLGSDTPAGDVLAAEVALVDLETDEARRLLRRVMERDDGVFADTAEHYLAWIESDDTGMAALAEVTALWALGDRKAACEEAEEVVKALADRDVRRSAALLWASRAVAAQQSTVAQGLLDDLESPPEGQVWRFQAIQAQVWMADGREKEAKDRLASLGPAPDRSEVTACATGWDGCQALYRLDWTTLDPSAAWSPFHDWPAEIQSTGRAPVPPAPADVVKRRPVVAPAPPTLLQTPDVVVADVEPIVEEPIVEEPVVEEPIVEEPIDKVRVAVICDDLFPLEGRALLGKLSAEEVSCLEVRMRIAPKQTEKSKVSKLLMANDFPQDPEAWERRAKHHLEKIDGSDPDLCLLYARRLARKGPAQATTVIYWSDRALERRAVWTHDTYVSRVNTLYKLRAAASQSMWKATSDELTTGPSDAVREREEHHRNNTKVYAREWLEYAQATGKDASKARALCNMAAGTSDYCGGA